MSNYSHTKMPISRKLRELAESILSHTLTPIGVSYLVQLRGETEPFAVRKSYLTRYCKTLMEAYEKEHPEILEHEKELKEKKAMNKKWPSAARTATKRPRLSEIDNRQEEVGPTPKRRRANTEAPKALKQTNGRRASIVLTNPIECQEDETKEKNFQTENNENDEVFETPDDQEEVITLDDTEEADAVENVKDNVKREEKVPTLPLGVKMEDRPLSLVERLHAPEQKLHAPEQKSFDIYAIFQENLRNYNQMPKEKDDEVKIIEKVNDEDDDCQIIEPPKKNVEPPVQEKKVTQKDAPAPVEPVIEPPAPVKEVEPPVPPPVQPPVEENIVRQMDLSQNFRAQMNKLDYTINELQKDRQNIINICMQLGVLANDFQQKIYELKDWRDNQIQNREG